MKAVTDKAGRKRACDAVVGSHIDVDADACTTGATAGEAGSSETHDAGTRAEEK